MIRGNFSSLRESGILEDMRTIPISDAEDPRLADYRDLTDVELRRVREPAEGLYIAESHKVIARALTCGHRPRSLLIQSKWLDDTVELVGENDVPVYVVSAEIAEKITGYPVHRGALAAMHRPAPRELSTILKNSRRVVVLSDIIDHTNVGAIFRSAAALGADAVLITPRCADPLYRRSVRVSMGTVFDIPWARLPEWSEAITTLHDNGFSLVGLACEEGAVDLTVFAAKPPERYALILGTEGDGLSTRALNTVDTVVTIPMSRGVDSLNVAAASAVALWATYRS